MNEQIHFGWEASVTAPKEYPIEIHAGYLASSMEPICALVNGGVEDNGWQSYGVGGTGGDQVPSQLSLTWVSYAEKKFWKIDTVIDSAKILALFREGFMYRDRIGETKHVTYKKIVIGTAPGGVVVIWLAGSDHRREIGRYQARPTEIGVNAFQQGLNPKNFTQQEFYDWNFNHEVPRETQEKIASTGIPYGLWDDYRLKYNWRFRIQFYKEDKEGERPIRYQNGEQEVVPVKELATFAPKPLPWRPDFYFAQKWGETEFDGEELVSVFKQISKGDTSLPIEIIGKVGFMYKTIDFTVKAGKIEVPLKKVEVHLWNN